MTTNEDNRIFLFYLHLEETLTKDKSDKFNKVLPTEFRSFKRDILALLAIVVAMEKIVNCLLNFQAACA